MQVLAIVVGLDMLEHHLTHGGTGPGRQQLDRLLAKFRRIPAATVGALGGVFWRFLINGHLWGWGMLAMTRCPSIGGNITVRPLSLYGINRESAV